MCSFTRVLPYKMSLQINLSWHEREARQNFRKCKQVQKHPDDIEYWIHLQERLNHPAYCKHCLHVMTSVAFGDLSRLTQTKFFSKNEQNWAKQVSTLFCWQAAVELQSTMGAAAVGLQSLLGLHYRWLLGIIHTPFPYWSVPLFTVEQQSPWAVLDRIFELAFMWHPIGNDFERACIWAKLKTKQKLCAVTLIRFCY